MPGNKAVYREAIPNPTLLKMNLQVFAFKHVSPWWYTGSWIFMCTVKHCRWCKRKLSWSTPCAAGMDTGRRSPPSFNVSAKGAAVTAGQPPTPGPSGIWSRDTSVGMETQRSPLGLSECWVQVLFEMSLDSKEKNPRSVLVLPSS